MIRRDAQWAHAGKVALGATVVVAAVAVAVALVANMVILERLSRAVDSRLASQLAMTRGATHPLADVPVELHGGDLDDAPTFVWLVTPAGTVTALTEGAPPLPRYRWSTGGVTLSTAGTTFRFDAARVPQGRLVAGESVVKIAQARNSLLVAEGVVGVLLVLVTFGGSFVIGLRASAPIEQIRRRQSEFTADASHELRTPLSVIQAEVDLALSRERDPASYRSTLRRISSESGRLHSIVEDLLWLARADADLPGQPSGRLADVGGIAAICVARFAAVADAASIELSDGSEPGTPRVVQADPDAVERLVTVLLDNACRYAGEGGSVAMSVDGAGGQVVLTVDDSGPGIPEDQREMVFDRFHRANDQPGGTGLGLAIADAVVRSSGGSWAILTSPLGGARMQVSWRQAPVHPAHGRADDAPTAPPPPGDQPANTTRAPTAS